MMRRSKRLTMKNAPIAIGILASKDLREKWTNRELNKPGLYMKKYGGNVLYYNHPVFYDEDVIIWYKGMINKTAKHLADIYLDALYNNISCNESFRT